MKTTLFNDLSGTQIMEGDILELKDGKQYHLKWNDKDEEWELHNTYTGKIIYPDYENMSTSKIRGQLT